MTTVTKGKTTTTKAALTERLRLFPVRTIARFINVSKTRRRVVFKECGHKGGTVGLGSRTTARCHACPAKPARLVKRAA